LESHAHGFHERLLSGPATKKGGVIPVIFLQQFGNFLRREEPGCDLIAIR